MDDLIEYRHVRKSFAKQGAGSETVVIADFSLAVRRGELLCLLGPSGCGKSTILNVTAGFEQCSGGEVVIGGRAISAPGPDRCVVFQEAMLFPWLNVIDNVCFGPRMAGVPSSVYGPKAKELLGRVGLSGFENHRSYELSGGMKQRVAIARALIMEPEILLMDEPFGALDAQTRLMMQELLVGILEQTRTTTLFVTHDIDEAMFLGDRICVMSARPGGIRSVIDLPFQRPRDYEAMMVDPNFGPIKRRIVHEVREETMKMMDRSQGKT
jgi:NitT/TauT family transport system ATP-binding protein